MLQLDILRSGVYMPFHIINAKKTFGNLGDSLLITDHGLQVLTDSVRQHWSELSPQDQGKWGHVFDLLNTGRSVRVYMMRNKNDAPNLKPLKANPNYFESGSCTGKGFVNITNFTSKSPDNEAFPENRDNWGWGVIEGIAPHTGMIRRWISRNDLQITFNSEVCRRVKTLQDKFETNEYVQVMYDATESLAEVNACVVFLGDGYLDGRGTLSPLAGARLFESSGSAYSTIRARGLRNAVVVHIKASLLHVDAESKPQHGSFDKLEAAIALQENRRLQAALEAASREQLIERLQKLDAQAEQSDPQKKRRM